VNKRRKTSTQRGFTLIEVLVAIVILALGASGVASMQWQALRTARQSAFQTSATQFAVELAELMRARRSPYLFSSLSEAGASADLQDWRQRLQQALPQAKAVACRDRNPAVADTLRWSCDQARGAAIVIKIGWSSQQMTLNSSDTAPPGIVLATEI